jgi:radical SAM superfamily enzyme YgiQ (UPF0313 family)
MVTRRDPTPPGTTPAEVGTIRKHWRGRIRAALVYPNRYHVGMSNLGFQAVYCAINALKDVVCERVFVDGEDAHRPPRSVESDRPVTDFDLLAFSISFENDTPGVLATLAGAGLPLLAADRSPHHPLVIAGGVACILNPEPLAPFIDCFLIGEAEGLVEAFFDTFDPSGDRTALLEKLASAVPGAYVPALYEPRYSPEGHFQGHRQLLPHLPDRVTHVRHPDLAANPTCSTVLTADTTFQKTYLVEVGRGCPHGCRFCSAGYIYRPPRFRPRKLLEACIASGAALTDRIGLVGAAVSDLPEIDQLCRTAENCDVQVSFSSLRADALSDELIAALRRSKVKTATIAPDAGSERMRRVINKGIEGADVLAAAERLVSAGIPNLRLYFMVGLPTEEPADIDAIVDLCKRVKHVFLQASRPRRRIGEITVSLSCFVPKPATPFQWSAMESVAQLKRKLKTVRNGLRKIANVRVTTDTPRWAFVQSLLARGDRRVATFLAHTLRNGGNWPQAFKEIALNADFYALRQRPLDEPLPWDIIDHGIDPAYLKREYRRAMAGRTSPPCPMRTCSECRICMSEAG